MPGPCHVCFLTDQNCISTDGGVPLPDDYGDTGRASTLTGLFFDIPRKCGVPNKVGFCLTNDKCEFNNRGDLSQKYDSRLGG